jgi:hypothetical protein
MSWILPMSHLASPARGIAVIGEGGDWLDFFEEFEEQTRGENFYGESVAVACGARGQQ